MCGISGIIALTPKQEYEASLQVMQKTLNHRGPDDCGSWHDNQVYFSHNRLSIIDLSTNARQPMFSYDLRFLIIFNGEIYNYLELKQDCCKLGSQFTSCSDTEVILECYRHFGHHAFEKFKGMWALALYDREKKQVIFSRDPFGIKPLYYGFYEETLYFASEPKALRTIKESFAIPDEISVSLFTEQRYLDRGDWTFYKNIKRFPHACYSIIDLNNSNLSIQPQHYWSPKTEILKIKYVDAVAELKRLLYNSIKLHLRSDVPIGACLSGGIDSSAIVSIGNKIHQQNFKTFTIFYSQYEHVNERQWAEKIIQHTNATSYFTEPTLESFLADFNAMCYTQDEPFGSTSIYAQYAIFKKIAAENIKVVLDGQGSDEQFSGYLGFIPLYLSSILNQGHYLKFIKENNKLKKNYQTSWSTKDLYRHLVKKIKIATSHYSATTQISLTEVKDRLDSRLQYLTYRPNNYEDILKMLLTDSNIPQLLRYEDRNSMAFSVESRVPFLEPELVNFVLSLPAEFKIKNGYTKAILRDALSDVMPDEIRYRINKLGFPTPEVEWLQQGFNLEVKEAGSKLWRELSVQKWRKQSTLKIL